MKRILTLSEQTALDFTNYCIDTLIPLAKPDVSNYAPNRKRLWLFHETNLRNTELSLGFFDQRLYNFCQRLYPGCNIALFSFGSKQNKDGLISKHRDHTFAQPIARTLNLGQATFAYDLERQAGNQKLFKLNNAELIEFNCKHLHALTEIHSELRLAINMWQLNEKKGYKPLF